ncbi:hypothetical protein [Paenibacillus physcomitrellae]|uniref:Flagellar hook-length control protein FliK n=1 Tax=Paenibacillus physcomitrellae TaxID=1619311 RepID=A0ABQ1GAJ3_9BACL|nr:hypothetical protein [Paenibacillus physcomitrellae]GGA39869.1 hypothetical protein GCM10010917_26430 [Paenibacillus physcomitrellae]
MNIGPIVRGVLGKSQPAEAKTLELRTGQVVRGTVLSVAEDGTEAVVEVQGVKLKAALETPLQQGQSMMMQVQPPGQDGLTVFKPLPSGSAAAGQDGNVEQLLKLAGLSDNADNRELVRLMQQAGLPVNREQADVLIKTLAAKPQEVPLPEWINAAAVAVQRGLPLSGEVVGGLRQAIFGPPVHQLLAALEEQLAGLLGGSGTEVDGQPPQGAGAKAADAAAVSVRPSAAAPEGTADADAASVGQGRAAADNAQAGGAAAGAAKAAAPGVDALLQKLQSVLGELRSELAAGRGDVRPDLAGVARGAAAGTETAAGGSAASGEAAQASAQPASGGAAQAGQTHETESWVARVLKLLGAEHEQQAGRALLQQAAPKAAAAESAPPGGAPSLRSADGGQAAGGEAAPAAGSAPPAAGGGAQSPGAAVPAPGAPAPAPAMAGQGSPTPAAAGAGDPAAGGPEAAPANPPAAQSSAAGDSHRRGEAVRGTEQAAGTMLPSAEPAGSRPGQVPAHLHAAGDIPAGAPGLGAGSPNASGSPAQTVPAPADSSVLALKDNLKSLLLQIIDTPDAPPQLQEAAKQMVQQLTGQQLLLNTDRTAPFAQVTMFLPFVGPEGGETATIQIQSRRGKRGELDPDNCRLWFDLNMSALGKLMVDVQVADKKVILQIHSEGEAAGAFLEGRQEEIGTAIQEAGYRLVAMRTDSYFTEEDKQENPVSQTGATSYVPPVYKGVDYRI